MNPMKQALSALVLLASVSASANTVATVYEKSTVLPQSLQFDLLTYLQTYCSEYVTDYGLSETNTTVQINQIDNGMTEYLYTTAMSSTYYFDGMHPSSADIVAETSMTRYRGNSIPQFEIRRVTVNGSDCK